MRRSQRQMVKKMGIGIAVGTAAMVVGSTMMNSKKRNMKKTMNHAAKTVGDIVDNIQGMMK